MTEDKRRLHIMLDREQIKMLRFRAAAEDSSISEVIRDAVDAYMEADSWMDSLRFQRGDAS